MKNQMKVNRTYNLMLDASFINFEIVGAPHYKDLDDEEIEKLMMDPEIKAICRQYLMDTLVNRVGIIHDYWFDGTEWEKDFNVTSEVVFEMVYGPDLKGRQMFLDMVKSQLGEMIEFMFDDEHIANCEVNWGISFI